MAHQRSDRLWKFEDSWTKLEIYVVGYVSHPKLDQLRCDVLVNAKTFSGEFPVVVAWEDAIRFANECESLAAALAESRLGNRAPLEELAWARFPRASQAAAAPIQPLHLTVAALRFIGGQHLASRRGR